MWKSILGPVKSVWRRMFGGPVCEAQSDTGAPVPLIANDGQASAGVSNRAVMPVRPSELVIGDDPSRPAFAVRPLRDAERFRSAKLVPVDKAVVGRLGAVLQGAPALLSAGAVNGRQLMEVSIDHALARAADGSCWRPFALDANGKIIEQAKLHGTEGLQNAMNVAAAWQVASVIVAQKHLADISAKLERIAEGMERISSFLEAERRSRITGTFRYLRQAVEAIQAGELTPALRIELEGCERDLVSVQDHLVQSIVEAASIRAQDADTAGTESLHAAATAKFQRIQGLVQDLSLCLKTRTLSWYVLSLFPGETRLKEARGQDIIEGLHDIRRIDEGIRIGLDSELARFKSMWNLQSTLDERKRDVRVAAGKALELTDGARSESLDAVAATKALLLKHDAPSTLIVQFDDGRLTGLREVARLAA